MKNENNSKNDLQNDEQRLLSSVSLDDLIKQKMEEEMRAHFESTQKVVKKSVVTELAKVPPHLVFSTKSVFRVFNRVTKQESLINGLQAEGLIGLQTSLRAKVKNGEQDAFSAGDVYVKFEKIEL